MSKQKDVLLEIAEFLADIANEKNIPNLREKAAELSAKAADAAAQDHVDNPGQTGP